MKSREPDYHMKMAELEDETTTIEYRMANSNGFGGFESGAKKA